MAKKREESRRVSFGVSTKERPAFKEELTAYVFDSRGDLLDRAPVRDGKVELSLTPGGLGRSRVLLAPIDEERAGKRVTLSYLQRLGAYEPVLQGPNGLVDHIQIPGIVIDKWPLCFCWVRGHVVRSNDNRAVCNARVHICEVDPIPWLIARLPDPDIFRLRDDLLDILRNPPIPRRPPIPDPDPGPLRGPRPGPDPAPFASALFRFADPGSIAGFNPQPDPPRPELASRFESPLSRVALNPQPLPPRERFSAFSASDRLSRVALNPQPLPPRTLAIQLAPEVSSALQSTSALIVRDALVANAKLLIPWLCYWPWWWRRFRCDEVAVLTTDAHGRFETTIFYPCGGDKPDLYFWVEYDFGSGFETVYHPWIACNTYWNYVCGTDVTIRVSDPRVPGCEDEPDLPGCQVVVLSLGRGVAVRQVQTAGTTQGLTTGGAPFGGSLEPRVDFSRTELITGKNIPYYRWSYRRLTAPDGGGGPVDAGSVPLNTWFVMTREVFRHYKVGTSYPPYFIGPMPTSGTDAAPIPNLFRIRPLDPPAPSPEWIVLDERVDLATSYFDTASLAGSPAGFAPTTDDLAAGRYEIKFELFDAAGNLVNWTASGIDLRITDQDAPFGTGTITTSPAPNVNRILSGSDTMGFRMTVRVDNNRCFADIQAVGGDVTPDPDCGFHNYNSTSDNATLSFVARHPNHFATYSLDVVRGSGAAHPVQTSGVSGEPGADGFSLVADFTYSRNVHVSELFVGSTCENAAFSELLNMSAMATDGYSSISAYNHGDHAAFALAKPCDCSGEQQNQGHGQGQGQGHGQG